MQRARQPRFPVGIQPRTFELVEDMLRKLQYSGPVALSCDDTKLLASFRPYYDEDQKKYFVMGHTGDPYELVDHEAFQRVVAKQGGAVDKTSGNSANAAAVANATASSVRLHNFNK